MSVAVAPLNKKDYITVISGYARINFNKDSPNIVSFHIIEYFYDKFIECIKYASNLGFEKVTIINKSDMKIIAKKNTYDVPLSYYRKGKSAKYVNETQELLDSWKNKLSFFFYGKKFQVINKNNRNNDSFIFGKEMSIGLNCHFCAMMQLKNIWLIVVGIAPSSARDFASYLGRKSFKTIDQGQKVAKDNLFSTLIQLGF